MSRIILIGCGKDKAASPAPAELLYIGGLFRARRQYARRSGARWWIVSAKHGMVRPSTVLSPYDFTIERYAPVDRAAWQLTTARMLLDDLADDEQLADLSIELHMGAKYAEPLMRSLTACGIACSWPVQGFGVGEQLAWYAERRLEVAA